MDMLPLQIQDAVVKRRKTRLIGPITLTLSDPGTTIVIGPNGAGKTTLLRLMHGLARLSSGRVHWACSESVARQRQSFVFQTPILLRRNLRENLTYPLTLAGSSHRNAVKIAEHWAARVGLSDALEVQASDLSGGERQKMALARAMVRDPAVLFLDEPCSSLDGRATREIETIVSEVRAAGTKVVMSTHDMGQARRLSDDVIFMLHGQVHEAGLSEAFFAQPATPEAKAFLKGDIVE